MKVILTALSAKQIHKTLSPWCLKSYCDEHLTNCNITVLEHTINDNLLTIVGEIYSHAPNIVGLACYIWNIEIVKILMGLLKKVMPNCIIIIGGPEVSFEKTITDFPAADYLIKGAGEIPLCELLNLIQNGDEPEKGIFASEHMTGFENFPSPYTQEYFDSFAQGRMLSAENQLVYYESSRGCPFSCAYCLSSVTFGVQYKTVEDVKKDLVLLVNSGTKCIKFVDRTFNSDKPRMKTLLEFVKSLDTNCTFHFEAAADLFNSSILELVESMPIGRIQFEIGIQSVNEQTLSVVSRKTNLEKALENIKLLTQTEKVQVHVDLIAGLPYDTMETIALGVNRCLAVRPSMLQLGFLKMLKGCMLRENSEEFGYIYTDAAPYEVLSNNFLSFSDLVSLKELESVIDKFYNSSIYKNTVEYATSTAFFDAYTFFRALADFCHGKNIYVSLKNSYTLLYQFLLSNGCQKSAAEHYIKLDCLTYDAKCMLPNEIENYRNRDIEQKFKKEKGSNLRAEYFPYDDKIRVFNYDINCKNPVTRSYEVYVIDQTC